jgi:hypothetical protein
MSEPQTVEALYHSTSSFVGFNPDDDMTEFCQFKYFRRFLIAYYESHQKVRGILSLEASFSFWSGGRHLSHIDDSEA